MKKSAALMLMIASILTSYFMIGCKHDLPGGNPIPPNCQGVTIDINTTAVPDTLGQSKGSIDATATSGGTSFTYSIDGNTFQSSGTFTGLTAGPYTITAKNENGCTGTAQVNVGNYDPCSGVTISVTATKVDPTTGQSNGSITVTAPLGAGYTYSKDGGASYQSGTTFSNLPAGNYTITAKNTAGCTGSTTVTLGATNPCTGVTISVTTTNTTAATTKCTSLASDYGSVTVSASGATGTFTYSKDGTTFQPSPTFNSLAPGTYTITAKSDAGCTGTVQATVAYTPTTISFSSQILPVFNSKCNSCHSYNSYTNVNNSYSKIAYKLKGNTNNALNCIPIIKPAVSNLYNMPPSGSLPTTTWALTVFDQWVIQGKPNN